MDMELDLEGNEVIEIEDDNDEDELEELEEMMSPRLSCRVSADGKKHHEILVYINDDLNVFKNRLEMIEPCSICYLPFSTQGNHQICCLPCGHLYGFSCIKKWLQISSGGKCPQCDTPCAYKDVILLYMSRSSAYQKTSSTRHFPLTKQGIREFREHVRLRHADTEKMHAEDSKKLVDVLDHGYAAVNKRMTLLTQLDDLLPQAEELEQQAENLGQADALRRQAGALKRLADALGHRYDALGRRADVLKQRKDELERRFSAFRQSLNFINKMYMEHKVHQMKIEPCSPAPTCHKN